MKNDIFYTIGKNSIIANFKGRIGNCMFIYAAARYLAFRLNKQCYFLDEPNNLRITDSEYGNFGMSEMLNMHLPKNFFPKHVLIRDLNSQSLTYNPIIERVTKEQDVF